MSLGPRFATDESIHVDKCIRHEWRSRGLRDVARKTDITTWRNAAERVPLAVLEMSDADHWSLRLLRELSRVTGEALICV